LDRGVRDEVGADFNLTASKNSKKSESKGRFGIFGK